jgi:aspartokinase
MHKISDTVYSILFNSETAFESYRMGFLNLRAYARDIQKEVEEITKKPVKIGTIVVALSRFSDSIKKTTPIKPPIIFDEISIKAPLSDITFENTKINLELARSFLKKLENAEDQFFTMTQGVTEITFLISNELSPKLLKHFSAKPKVISSNLAGINVRFSEKYLNLPNVIYAILAKLAIKKINLVEIVSTYTELTMIFNQEDLVKAFNELNKLFKRESTIT